MSDEQLKELESDARAAVLKAVRAREKCASYVNAANPELVIALSAEIKTMESLIGALEQRRNQDSVTIRNSSKRLAWAEGMLQRAEGFFTGFSQERNSHWVDDYRDGPTEEGKK